MADKQQEDRRSSVGMGSTYRKGNARDLASQQEIGSVMGGQVWMVKPDKKAKAPGGLGSFSDIETIVATGGVKLTRKDDGGKLLIASADTASYNAKTKDMVIRGGFPRVQQDQNMVIAQEPGLYIKIYGNGKAYFQPGHWKTILVKDVKKDN